MLAGSKGGRVEAIASGVQSATKDSKSDREWMIQKPTYAAGVDLGEVAAYCIPFICPVHERHSLIIRWRDGQRSTAVLGPRTSRSQVAENERTVPIGCTAFPSWSAPPHEGSPNGLVAVAERCARIPPEAHFLPGDRYEMTAGHWMSKCAVRYCLMCLSVV